MKLHDFFAKTALWISRVWMVTGLLIGYWILLNAAAAVIVTSIQHVRRKSQPVIGESYQSAPWMAEYLTSLNHIEAMWHPFAYWKIAPTHSRYLNVDQNGRRVTWNKQWRQGHNGLPRLRVFLFGGSTMWGHGVRDEYTVPSLVAKHLAAKTDYHVELANYGQIGYVTTQEVLLLYELLRDGQRPDVVVFYDGINDSLAAYQSGIAGLSIDEFNRVLEFNLLNPRYKRNLYLSAVGAALLDSKVFELLNLIRYGDSKAPSTDNAGPRKIMNFLAPPQQQDSPEMLEERAVHVYLFNKLVVEAWGRQFGFRALFYWQPAIYTKNKLTPIERDYLGDPRIKELVLGIYRHLHELASTEGIKDLSDVFTDKDRTYFRDMVHLNEAGNEIIADTMSPDIAGLLGAVERDRSARGLPGCRPASTASH